jgi:hypothetical protein
MSNTRIKCNNNIDDIEPSGQPSKFIFFGCWNNINCDSEFMYRDIVLDYIKENESDVKQLYIAGDNWYTNKKIIKKKELKLYITEVLRTGYDKLYRMGKDIYIAVGNHDIDSNISVGKKLASVSPPINTSSVSSVSSPANTSSTSNPSSTSREARIELKKDCNINTQKYYLQQIKKGREFETPTLELLQNIKDIELSEAALCEQGIYIYVENIGVRYNNKSIIIIINTNKFDDYDGGLQYLSEIENVIMEVKRSQRSQRSQNGKSKQIFVMGHIPLFTNKKNKLSIQEINKKDLKFRQIIYGLFDILTQYKIIYLCADTHNFSIMKITHNDKVLIQITAGTGGADPDLIDNTPKTPITKKFIDENNKEYDITAYSINSYGYASINIVASDIYVCYTQVIEAPLPEELALPTPSYTSVQKITYKITKKYPYLTYKSNIKEIGYYNDLLNYKTNGTDGICKKIKDDPKGYITGKEGKLFCYKKKIKKINKV